MIWVYMCECISELYSGFIACSVSQLCPTLLTPVDCSLPGSSVHGIFQARILEWIAISVSSFNCMLLSCIQLFVTPWTTARQLSLSFIIPGLFSNSCPLSWWCHLTILSSVVAFSPCLRSFLASGSHFPWVGFLHQVAKVLELQLFIVYAYAYASLSWLCCFIISKSDSISHTIFFFFFKIA